MTRVLVVDDDRDLVDLLVFALERAGFAPVAAHDVPAARRALTAAPPALIVLDVNLGAESGFDLLRELRPGNQTPVILLTARAAEDDKVLGLELGADDYLTKPFSHRELIARIRAHLRRQGQGAPAARSAATLQVGPLTLSLAEHQATRDGQPLELTVTEFRLLHYLMARAGVVVSTRELLRDIWGFDDPIETDVVRVTIYRLRRKIEIDPARPGLLHTIPGVGVLLRPATG
jgi:two-component system response regulator VicR